MSLRQLMMAQAAVGSAEYFPIWEGANVSAMASSTNHNVSMPATVANGDLLIVTIGLSNTFTITTPSGWTLLTNVTSGVCRQSIYYIVGTSALSGTTVNFVTSGSVAATAVVNRIAANSYRGVPEAATATGASINPDAPSLSPSWGSGSTIWLAVNSILGNNLTTVFPLQAGHSTAGPSGLGLSTSTCFSLQELGTLDPAAFTASSSNSWVAATIAVRSGTTVPARTLSLLHMDGTNGSTTFTDAQGRAWSAVGNAQITTTTPKFGTGAGLFDGAGDYLNSSNVAALTILGNFTIEAWINRNATKTSALFTKYNNSSNGVFLELSSTGFPFFGFGVGSYISVTSSIVAPLNSYCHVAAVKAGSRGLLFVDGVLGGSFNITGTVVDGPNSANIGRDDLDLARDFPGRIDEFRFSNMVRYTNNFTPPTAPFTYQG